MVDGGRRATRIQLGRQQRWVHGVGGHADARDYTRAPWALITPGRASRNGRDHGSESKDRGHANGAGMRTAKVVARQEVAIVSDM